LQMLVNVCKPRIIANFIKYLQKYLMIHHIY